MQVLQQNDQGAEEVRPGSQEGVAGSGASVLNKDILKICGTTDELTLIIRGGEVVRYHAEGSTVRKQSVAEHTWRVLIILLHLWPDTPRDVILATLYHDVPEVFTGDTPATVKIASRSVDASLCRMEHTFIEALSIPNEGALTHKEYRKLKCADYLELYLTCRQQTSRRASQLAENGKGLIGVHVQCLPEEDQRKVANLLYKIDEFFSEK